VGRCTSHARPSGSCCWGYILRCRCSSPSAFQGSARDQIRSFRSRSLKLSPFVNPAPGSVRRRRILAVLAAMTAIEACTPLGGWLYDDPTFVLSELTVRGGGSAPADTLELVLTACNRNDFPIQALGFEVSFEIAGTPLGSAQSSQAVTLQTRDSTKLTVPFALHPGSSDSSARRSYVLTGFTTLMTPIGERRVNLYQKGAVSLKPKDVVAHIPAAGRPCRPGQSSLPSYMPIPVLIDPSQPPIPTQSPPQR
jgi:hypothetical protein